MNGLFGLLAAIPGQVWIGLIVGGFCGYSVGIWRAENGRARFDMDKTWKGRSNWRQSGD